MQSVFIYTLARLGLLGLSLGLGYVAGLRGAMLVIAAFLGSGAVALVVLDKQRGSMGLKVAGFFGKINKRIDESTRKEDLD